MSPAGLTQPTPHLKGRFSSYDFCTHNETGTTGNTDKHHYGTSVALVLVGNSSIYKGMVPDAQVRVCYSRIMCNSTIPSEECADDLLEILMRPIDDKVDVLAIPMGVSKRVICAPFGTG